MDLDEDRLPVSVNEAACRLAELELSSRDDLVASVAALRRAIADVGSEAVDVTELSRTTDALAASCDGGPAEREPAVRSVARALDQMMNRLAGDPEPVDPACSDDGGEANVLGEDPEMVGEFVEESRELLEQCEQALLRLEADPGDLDAINTVFRGFHTIKGTAACLGLDGVSRLAHRAESLLSRVRDRELRFDARVADLALRARDALRQRVEAVARRSRGEPVEVAAGPAELDRALESACAEAGPTAGDRPEAATSGAVAAPADGESGPARVAELAAESVRVRTDRLDRLVDLVGELVVSHSMVAEEAGRVSSNHDELARCVQKSAKLVRELRDLGLSLRMVPLAGVFRKLQRAVRDVMLRSGKQVEFLTHGEETEIDRNMVDRIADPLMHMVRNAVDHGIEPAADRLAAGKPARGTVRLTAHQAGGSVALRLEDDGRGLDRRRILRRAIERGMVAANAEMTDAAVHDLLFQPGFSTAEQVTDVSGRGVGLDVVRKNIEALQGRVEITSNPGRGTVFVIKLPLTLAIADGMQVRCGGQRFIVPTVNIQMSLRPETPPRTVQGRGEVLRLRDELLPVFRLERLFGIPEAEADPCRGLLMVLDDGDARFALLVDELLSHQQVVVKPLNASIGKVPGVSGAAVLGDGSVGLILEPGELAHLGRRNAHAGPPA